MQLRTTLRIAALLSSAPVVANAQLQLPTSVSTPTAITAKPIVAGDIRALTGTTTSSATTFLGASCGKACIVATAASGGNPAITLHPKSPDKAKEFHTGLIISHDVKHSVDVSLSGSSIVGLLCNGFLVVAPHFMEFGAKSAGFSWAIFDGDKLVNSGHSSGDAVKHGTGGGEGHTMTMPMELSISDHGVIEILHMGQRLVITPDDKSGIGAKTGGYLKFDDLGLRVAGPSSFGLVEPTLKY